MMLRTILAVVAGYVVSAILVLTGDAIMGVLFGEYFYQTSLALVWLVGFGIVCAAAGGWVAARVAGEKFERHGIYLGAVMVVFGVLSFFAPQEGRPLWYKLTLIAIAIPSAWAGARLHALRSIRRANA